MYYKNTYKIRELQKTCSLTNISQKIIILIVSEYALYFLQIYKLYILRMFWKKISWLL